MKISTSDDVAKFMQSYVESAALSAALELGLFWILAERPLPGSAIAQMLDIPPIRCHYWLELLCNMALLERAAGEYTTSSTACDAIIDSYSRETWKLLAQEARERFKSVNDLAVHIKEPGSVWSAQGLNSPDYVVQMQRSLDRARRFARMLYEIHQPLAEELVQTLNMAGVKRMMDLGGGSGVISMALLGRYRDLMSVVVDLDNVCAAGREIASENSIEGRLTFHPADIMREELPPGFDMVLECDVGLYDESLFNKVWASLNVGGSFAIVDHLTLAESIEPQSRLAQVFQDSLANPTFALPTAKEIEATLNRARFEVSDIHRLSNGMDLIVSERN